ncbi:MAG: type II toxin-antitoxin system RelE/ParE family toxin, partial [Cyclobacteriaceae bacterium]|nr:type II toxin-antitoxin system RelE/ParE family toxin [Cyclobacteriaceae bacterium HetDA_MAG_MS6]
DQQLQALSTAVEQKIKLISQNPYLFQVSNEHPEVRRAVVIKLNSIYFRIKEDQVEILSFYANRKDPEDRKL